jgi:hypothetical protein
VYRMHLASNVLPANPTSHHIIIRALLTNPTPPPLAIDPTRQHSHGEEK